MPRPRPTKLFHFTHVDHLASIARDGLVCDTQAHIDGRLVREVGDVDIKERRRHRRVTAEPGGVVADYVPFYFAPRGPMLLMIHRGQVATYKGGQAGLIFLATTLDRVQELGLAWVASDRNAATNLARFTDDLTALDSFVDWPIMETTSWGMTDDDPDRPKRRQAELLVHEALPWEAIMFIGARNAEDLAQVEDVVGNLKGHQPRRDVRAGWYF